MTGADCPIDVIFSAAIEIRSLEERDSYLMQACGGNTTCREQVQRLIDAHFRAGTFLDSPAPELNATVDQHIGFEQIGQMIGSYKLRERLGAGGFGIVWAAEQTEPIRRKVAIKIIKPGMDTSSVVARFEAERQALALMDHPNIARVFDAGTTVHGRPYFVMELIRGLPLLRYCDENRLSIRERLDIFLQICHAVQHAHQRGVIHRDIKPSNVLVTQHDGVAVPKVIDFGVAKAVNQQLTNKTIYTCVHQAVGTLPYMSPEQAELSGLDVDTRADIYGLGVLLYELLTGETPIERNRLEQAALHEACRIIREEEPPKPSTRLSSLGDTLTTVADRRKADPRKLSGLLKGELDWIVMKALEKDRGRRYDTAKDFAADIQRYIHQEPIAARPPSFAYRTRKFARRNRRSLCTTTLLLTIAALIGYSLFTVYDGIKDKRIDDLANRAVEAWGLYRKGQYAESETRLKELVPGYERYFGATAPETRRAELSLSLALLRQGKITAALPLLQRLQRYESLKSEPLFDELTQQCFKATRVSSGDEPPAVGSDVVELARFAALVDMEEGYYLLARVLYGNGKYDQSLDAMKRQLERRGYTHHWRLLVAIYTRLGDTEMARDCYLMLLERRARLGQRYASRFMRGIATELGYSGDWLTLPRHWPAQNMNDEQYIAAYTRVTRVLPQTDAPYRFRANYHARHGNWDQAIEDFRKCAQSESSYRPEGWMGLAALTLGCRGIDQYQQVCREAERELMHRAHAIPNSRWLFEATLAIIGALNANARLDKERVFTAVQRISDAENSVTDLAYVMAAYRCGRYEDVVSAVPTVQNDASKSAGLAFAAMAAHELGDLALARQFLNEARAEVPTVKDATNNWLWERPTLACICYLSVGEAERKIENRLTKGIDPGQGVPNE